MSAGLVSAYGADTNDDEQINFIKFDGNNGFENNLILLNQNKDIINSNFVTMGTSPESSNGGSAGYFSIEGNGEILWSYESNSEYPEIDAYPLDDINSDGTIDYVIIDEFDEEDQILALSGSDGSIIWNETCAGIAENVISINNDLDSDNIDDIVIVYLSEQSIFVELISGSSGDSIQTTEVKTYSLEYDIDCWASPIEDATGDGIEDIILETEIGYESDHYEDTTYLLSGSDGSIIFTIPDYVYWEFTDLTGDGLTDIVKDDYNWDTHILNLSVYEGKSGNLVWNSTFNGRILGISDVNGNDVSDLLTVNLDQNLSAFKGSDGSELWNTPGEWSINEYPMYASIISDVNSDGIDDFALFLITENYDHYTERLQFRSGFNGELLWNWEVPIIATDDIIACNDIDGDGIEDIICTNSTELGPNEYLFNTTAYKGTEGTKIWDWSGQYLLENNIDSTEWTLQWQDSYSWASTLSDISGDGIPDPILEIEIFEGYTNETDVRFDSSTNLIVAIDGNTGSTLWKFETGKISEYYELYPRLTAWFDLNKDNIDDYLFANTNGLYAMSTTGTQVPPTNDAPTATINDISPATATLGETISFTGSGEDTDGSVVAYKWTSSIDGLLSTSSSFSTTDLSIGTHTISFSVQDDDGAWSDAKSSTVIVIDDVAPEVHISADPVEYISVYNPVTINLNSTDAYLASTNLIIADSEGLEIINQSVDKDEPTRSSFEYVWNATDLNGDPVASGTYFLYVNSTDASDNYASANVSVSVDNDDPTVEFDEIKCFTSDSNYVYACSELLINTSASGTPGEVDSLEYTLESVSTNYKDSISAELIDGIWTAAFDLSLIPDDGRYVLTATAVDAAHNSNSTTFGKLAIIDHTSPVFSSTISRYNDTHGMVSVRSSEPITGLPVVEINSAAIGVVQNSVNWTGYFQIDGEQMFNLNATGTDLAGNIGSGSSTAFMETVVFADGSGTFNSSKSGTAIIFNATNDTSGTIVVTESKEPMANMTDGSVGLYFIDVELDDSLAENMSNAKIAVPIISVILPDGISKEDISIRYYNETEELWEIYETSIEIIDDEECWVTYVDHFSTYGIIATDQIAPVLDSMTPVTKTEFNKDTTSVDIRFDFSDEQTGINISSIVFELDGTEITEGALEITSSYVSYTATGLSSGSSHTASVTVADNADNSAVFSTSFSIASTTTTKPKSNGGSSSGGGSITSGETFGNIMFKDVKTENIVGGSDISFVFDEDQNAVQYINFHALRNYGKVSTTIEVLKGRSAMVDENSPGLVYRNLNIWVGRSGFATEDNIADPVIGFSVAKEWLTENGIDENSVILYRHSEGKWNALTTLKVREDDSFLYFEAETPGFSPFAIATDVDAETSKENADHADESYSSDDAGPSGEDPAENEPNGIPGISILTSVFILLFACLFRKGKN